MGIGVSAIGRYIYELVLRKELSAPLACRRRPILPTVSDRTSKVPAKSFSLQLNIAIY
jgi:hypothetical protein